MRRLLWSVAATVMMLGNASATGEIGQSAIEDLDLLAIFHVANKKCVGQYFDDVAIARNMRRIAESLLWGEEKILIEIGNRFAEQLEDYEDDPEFFCWFSAGERQRSEVKLRTLGIID
jgi:hypothetical protein